MRIVSLKGHSRLCAHVLTVLRREGQQSGVVLVVLQGWGASIVITALLRLKASVHGHVRLGTISLLSALARNQPLLLCKTAETLA